APPMRRCRPRHARPRCRLPPRKCRSRPRSPPQHWPVANVSSRGEFPPRRGSRPKVGRRNAWRLYAISCRVAGREILTSHHWRHKPTRRQGTCFRKLVQEIIASWPSWVLHGLAAFSLPLEAELTASLRAAFTIPFIAPTGKGFSPSHHTFDLAP